MGRGSAAFCRSPSARSLLRVCREHGRRECTALTARVQGELLFGIGAACGSPSVV